MKKEIIYSNIDFWHISVEKYVPNYLISLLSNQIKSNQIMNVGEALGSISQHFSSSL